MNNKYKIGDKVILKGNPYDEQIPEELEKFVNLASKTHTVTAIKDVGEIGTSGQWIKTDLISEWIDGHWFMLEERG